MSELNESQINYFIETEETLGWTDDPGSLRLRAFEKEIREQGFVQVPNDHPVGIDGWDYRFYGPLAYYKKQTNP